MLLIAIIPSIIICLAILFGTIGEIYFMMTEIGFLFSLLFKPSDTFIYFKCCSMVSFLKFKKMYTIFSYSFIFIFTLFKFWNYC